MARRVDVNTALPAAIENPTIRTLHAHGSAQSMSSTPSRAAPVLTPGLTVPSSVQAKVLLLQGKLQRRDRTFLTWKWRDFYLEQQRLQYFNEKGVRKGEILITATTPIVIRLLSEPKPFGFLVFIKDEKLTLAAATAQDRQKWIDVFTDVFHANVEDFQTNAKAAGNGANASGSGAVGGGGDKPEKKRTRPTFLPIPDMSEDEGSGGSSSSLLHLHHHHATAGSKTPVLGPQTPVLNAAPTPGLLGKVPSRLTLGRRQSEGALPQSTSAAALATAAAAAASALSLKAVAAAAAAAEAEPELQERRSFYRNSDGALGVDVMVPRSKFIALKEQYSNVTFPRTLANGDVLVGVGPLVRRMGWTDERILAVGLYVDADAAAKELVRFYGRSLKSVRGDQAFYDYLVQHSKFRRSIVVTSRKRVSKSVIIALLHDEMAPRMSGSTEALHTFLHFIEKSLRKAESMMLRIHPEGGRLDFRLRGQQYPPIASSLLCQCIQSVFFDVNSIQQDAKRRLIQRFPLLWGMEEFPEDTLLTHGNSDRDLLGHELEPRHNGILSESEDDDDDDDDDEDDDIAAPMLRRDSTSASESVASTFAPKRSVLSMKEKLDQLDEEEHELIRRESRSLGVHFGPIVDKDSNVQFKGDLLVDASTLLGTWSQKITYMVDAEAPEKSCVVSVGLYADSGGACEALLKYKGLSVGSILQDPDFFARFADGPFTKHLVFKVEESMSVAKLVDYFTARVRRRGSGTGLAGGNESGRSSDAKARQLLERLEDQRVGNLRPVDELQVTIGSDSRMTLTVNRQFNSVEEEEQYPPVTGISVGAPPFSSTFQGIFYGYHTIDPASRTQLIERLPSLLDLARDDLAQTYYDEIQVLRENYKRQLPEFRLKAGYMLISFEKKKMEKNAEGVKEQTVTASKWSKRWCRLDGTTFSYFSHKRSRKPREIIDLIKCAVSEINATSANTGLAPFAFDKGNVRPSIRIGIEKPNGEILALKTESIFEGVEWLESLVEASDVKSRQVPQASDGEDTDQAAIETSGGGDADESSGVHEEDDVGCEDDADALATAARRVSVHRPSVVGFEDAVVKKHGSLLSWIMEDTRHAFILALLVLIAWLVTSQQPVFIQQVASAAQDGNSSVASSTGH